MRRFMISIWLSSLASAPSLAAEPYVGTWSLEKLNCSAAAETQSRTVYVLAKHSLSIPPFGCERARYRKSSSGWMITVSKCYGSPGASGAEVEEPFTRVLRAATDGSTLRLTWPGFDSGALIKCSGETTRQ
jgi:hypothetical protein